MQNQMDRNCRVEIMSSRLDYKESMQKSNGLYNFRPYPVSVPKTPRGFRTPGS